jgi:hypothetical protein
MIFLAKFDHFLSHDKKSNTIKPELTITFEQRSLAYNDHYLGVYVLICS